MPKDTWIVRHKQIQRLGKNNFNEQPKTKLFKHLETIKNDGYIVTKNKRHTKYKSASIFIILIKYKSV